MRKIEIARSHSRKINLGNYESADFFASYKAEVEEKDDEAEVSENLYQRAKEDVERDIAEFLALRGRSKEMNVERVVNAVDKISINSPLPLEDYTNLQGDELKIVQAVKRAYKRSNLYKDTIKKRK